MQATMKSKDQGLTNTFRVESSAFYPGILEVIYGVSRTREHRTLTSLLAHQKYSESDRSAMSLLVLGDVHARGPFIRGEDMYTRLGKTTDAVQK